LKPFTEVEARSAVPVAELAHVPEHEREEMQSAAAPSSDYELEEYRKLRFQEQKDERVLFLRLVGKVLESSPDKGFTNPELEVIPLSSALARLALCKL
jgi:hypothetical protein